VRSHAAERNHRFNLAAKKGDFSHDYWTTAFKGQNGEILSAIWNAPKHRLSSIKICTLAWGDGAVSKNTFKGTLKRVRKALEKAGCGYILKAIKSGKTGEVMGYGLRKARVQK